MNHLVVRTADGATLCPRCELADTPWRRLRGLLGRELPADEGLLIRPSSSVHMFFMGFAIDAVFLDREQRVVRIAAGLAPWRMASCRGARAVLELPAGACARAGVREGDVLRTD
ncbi:MAG: hypothetical protein JWM31_3114 [Solirubrobacterales bacterium]|nr:hypothetical protein [Solirubrobacterales bacterium]